VVRFGVLGRAKAEGHGQRPVAASVVIGVARRRRRRFPLLLAFFFSPLSLSPCPSLALLSSPALLH
jgi:hypothetical protein